ncbi:inositol-pentakisphosphate 2-kinase-like isoform X2 [Uloborus diversus]|uniref:inositol-pentakisphosphate 2-kinase-like isoform X2 n=1 Tax=Uloborus diversus TaxID=327109 RepID=UPI002409ACFD|nr:inositol-pentakisphosphate 2-kinase-like isoform X2 [Uloborus diversus]
MSLDISPENCSYRGEGNVGLVISLKKEEKVLKLIKQENGSVVVNHEESFFKELENQVKIVENVMKPLLGNAFVNTPVIVHLQKDEIKMINGMVDKFRPGSRQHKSVKEEDCHVFMLPDYCSLPPHMKMFPSFGPVISIEIKPKQGFVLSDNDSSLSPNSYSTCRFCLMQGYKMRRGVISSRSAYCPTDLFSGCSLRMLHALKMLLKSPQNNFRMFKDQKLVYSEEKKEDLNKLLSDFFDSEKKSYSDMLCNLVIKALLEPFEEGSYKFLVHLLNKISQRCANSNPCEENEFCHKLPRGCVLERILNVQSLDTMELTKLYPLYRKIIVNSEQSSDYVGCISRYSIPSHVGENLKQSNESDYHFASRKVWEFLVALTMKDCSIMLAFKKVLNCGLKLRNQNVISDDYGNSYLMSIAIADLDIKHISKVEKLYKERPFLLESCA